MRAPSFKAQCRQTPRQTPPAPRPAFEPISPVLGPSDLPAHVSAGAKDTTTEQAAHGAPPAVRFDDNARDNARSQSPPRLSLLSAPRELPPPPPANPPFSPTIRSPIDALANAAVSSLEATRSYIEAVRRRAHDPTSPGAAVAPRPPKHAYPEAAPSSYAEPPSKRARSEILPSPLPAPQQYSRPVTSHNSGWSYNVEHMANAGVRMYQDPTAPDSLPQDSGQAQRLYEAQLLLHFAIAVGTPAPPVQPRIPPPERWQVHYPEASDRHASREAIEPNNVHLPTPHYTNSAVEHSIQPPIKPSAPPADLAPPASPVQDSASLAVQTHTPPQDSSSSLIPPAVEEANRVEEKKPKKHQGWPKGKPRGPRHGPAAEKKKKSTPKPPANPPSTVPTTLPVLQQVPSPQSLPTDALDDISPVDIPQDDVQPTEVQQDDTQQIEIPQDDIKPVEIPEDVEMAEVPKDDAQIAEVRLDEAAIVEVLEQTPRPLVLQARRLSESHPPEAQEPCVPSTSPLAKSVPASTSMTITPCSDDTNIVGQHKAPDVDRGPDVTQATICAGCHSSDSVTSIGDGEQWISCDGCKGWFHYACAGFKSEREVRAIDKFYCDGCRPKFGNTTKLRKSSRAHTAVDYAGLNEGIMKTSDDNPEHHYIQAFKNGDITFSPETFARLPAECVTADFVEKMNGFEEPLVIPAALNPRPQSPGVEPSTSQPTTHSHREDAIDEQYPYELVADDGQDKIDMVIPKGLTVRRVAELYGPTETVPVIDVKSQDGMDQWTMAKWADYYEQEGEKPVRNVISLEVSRSRLGRLIRRPKIVRDMDLQDSVWREDDKFLPPAVQFYCLMSVADCYTDFHIDFGGSSVYYHIIKGRKTFFFIPPTKQNLKKYEEWCLSPRQSQDFLGHQVKECYRVDLFPGDTMLIPSGWIHAVWTPEDSLVIGGNYLTRIHYGMQIKILEIEKNTKVAAKFRYPFFQKIMWLAVIKYLEDDPLPSSVEELLLSGGQFDRSLPIYCEPDKFGHNSDLGPENYNTRYYPKGELEGLADLVNYIWRTVMISLGRIEGVTQVTRNAVTRSIPKGHGEPSILARRFAMWVAWKKGNEKIPEWALPDTTLPDVASDSTLSSAQAKRMERESWNETLKLVRGGERHSSLRARVSEQAVNGESRLQAGPPVTGFLRPHREHVTTPKTSQLGPKRIACDACRKRRIRCKHKDELVESPQSSASGGGHRNIPASSSPPATGPGLGELAVRRHSEADISPGALPYPSPFDLQGSVNGGPISADMSAAELANKSGRVKACADCRKSKRRCIHDENGNVDPVKAAEAPVPRGSASKKRRSDDDDGEALTKKMKMESFAGLLDGEVSHWNRYPLQKPRPASATESRERESMAVESAQDRGSPQDPNIDPQLMDVAGDAMRVANSSLMPTETVVSSIEANDGDPMDGVEMNDVEEPDPIDPRLQDPEPRTPAPPAPYMLHDSPNGVAVVSPSEASTVRTASRAPPVSTTPNWSRSSRVSVRSWNGIENGYHTAAQTTPSGKGRRSSKDSTKLAHPKSEQKPKPRAMSSTKSTTGKSKEDLASMALALKLQMEEHGLRRRSK